MPGFTYQLTLLTDATFTAVNATTDTETLTRVPGAVLLGAAARNGYPSDPGRAWEIFHSGRVRFGGALPVHASSPGASGMAVPTPKTLHEAKEGGGATLFNLLRGRPNVALAAVKKPFLAPSGVAFALEVRSSVRTAIDAATGRAKDGHLYALEAVPAGTRFIGRITADRRSDVDEVRQLLEGRELRLGRSRTAELGVARLDVLGDAWLAHGPAREGRAAFLCLSDLVLRHPDGAPRLTPTGADVGLEGWTFSPEDSVVRVRTWSPWNAHRRRPDLERQAIEAGSVLVFVGAGKPAREAVIAALDAGVGEHRQDGLGQLWFEPAPLQADTVAPWSSVSAPEGESTPVPEPKGALTAWLEQKATAATRADILHRQAGDEARKSVYRRVPRSQWGELRALAQTTPDAARLREVVRRMLESEPPAAGPNRDPRAATAPRPRTGFTRRLLWHGGAYQALTRYLEAAKDDAAIALELLANRAPRIRDASEEGR